MDRDPPRPETAPGQQVREQGQVDDHRRIVAHPADDLRGLPGGVPGLRAHGARVHDRVRGGDVQAEKDAQLKAER